MQLPQAATPPAHATVVHAGTHTDGADVQT
jgi:hypothetical protein